MSQFTRATLAAEAQCWARRISETPANVCTPSYFCEQVARLFEGANHVTVDGHDRAWAEAQKMGSFLSVARGSDEPCRFLVLKYTPDEFQDQGLPNLAYVGKGITFDTGGISLKPPAMEDMRGDMTGAAVVCAAAYVIARHRLPINLFVACPLTENMPSGHATKPSDVVTARTGKTIEVGNTDAEGRLVLADALSYIEDTFSPQAIVDVATLTGAVGVALGPFYIGGYSRSDAQWSQLEHAGHLTGENVWRLPLDPRYRSLLDSSIADINNYSADRVAGSILGATFLSEFVKSPAWAHLDIAGTTWSKKDDGYKCRGNIAVGVRLLASYAEALAVKK